MDTPAESGNFLQTRRARLQPEDVGLVSTAPGAAYRACAARSRHTRRASASRTTRLEQGQSHNASDGVLDAPARAL